jgi:hypothetical protein
MSFRRPYYKLSKFVVRIALALLEAELCTFTVLALKFALARGRLLRVIGWQMPNVLPSLSNVVTALVRLIAY